MKASYAGLFALALAGCTEDTGSGLVEFDAYAGGHLRDDPEAEYVFDTSAGYRVTLERARLTIGALYLNRARPILGAQDTACVLPGLYAAEVRSGVTIDALSPELVPFDEPGRGTADRALTGEVWLTGGIIDAENDGTKILDFAGTATSSSASFGFRGVITIGRNRIVASPDPATPGANPACKQRIVTPIPIDVTPNSRGRLVLRVEPEIWFDRVDFAQLPTAGTGEVLEIPDSNSDPVAMTLFQGLRSIGGYELEWKE